MPMNSTPLLDLSVQNETTPRRAYSGLPLGVGVAFGKRHSMRTRSHTADTLPAIVVARTIVVAHLAITGSHAILMQVQYAALSSLVGKSSQEILGRLGRAGPTASHAPNPFRSAPLSC